MDVLDRFLMEQADEWVQAEEEEQITPWESAIRSIVWGFLLISFHVNFFGFPPEFVFSVLGLFLITRGFSQIAHLNPYLKWGFRLSLTALIWHEADLILNCTTFQIPIVYRMGSGIAMIAIRSMLFFLLYKGLPEFVKNEVEKEKIRESLYLNIKYLLATFILIGIGTILSGTLLSWGIVILYLMLLYQIIKNLDESKMLLLDYAYDMKPISSEAGTRVKWLLRGLLVFLVIAMPLTMYESAKPADHAINVDLWDGSDRLLYGANFDELANRVDLPEEWFIERIEMIIEDPEREVAGKEAAAVDPKKVKEIRRAMVEAGVEEWVVSTLPPVEILRYEGISKVYTGEVNGNESEIKNEYYLCYMNETQTYRFLFYGSWRNMPKERYTDGLILWLRDDLVGLSDLTGGVIGEVSGEFMYQKMGLASLQPYGNGDLRFTVPVPQKGQRYDFYLAMNCEPEIYVEGKKWVNFVLPINLYHRESLWCFPGQSAEDALRGYNTDWMNVFLNGNQGNRILKYKDYFSAIINEEK